MNLGSVYSAFFPDFSWYAMFSQPVQFIAALLSGEMLTFVEADSGARNTPVPQ